MLQVDDKDGVTVTLDSITWEEHITGVDGHPEVRDCLEAIAVVLRKPNVVVESGTSIVYARLGACSKYPNLYLRVVVGLSPGSAKLGTVRTVFLSRIPPQGKLLWMQKS